MSREVTHRYVLEQRHAIQRAKLDGGGETLYSWAPMSGVQLFTCRSDAHRWFVRAVAPNLGAYSDELVARQWRWMSKALGVRVRRVEGELP